MSLEARAMTFAGETKLDAGVVAWLEKTGLTTLEDIAEIAHDEAPAMLSSSPRRSRKA